MRTSRPRVLLIHPYWEFWERSVPYDLRADRARLGNEIKAVLDVDWVDERDADCALVVETMASPPAATLSVLPDLPLVIWTAHRWSRIPDDFDHAGITAEGGTVGTPMLTSVLVREGRPFELVIGRVEDGETCAKVFGALVGAAAANRVRGARIARVGSSPEGYLCVETPDERLQQELGVEIVRLDPSEVARAYDRVSESQIDQVRAETGALYSVEITGDGLERSLRMACALEQLVERYELSAGAMNCHVPEIRLGGVGIAPCFALGRSTSRGVPWSCTGDVLTAIALLLSKWLGGAAQYHELESYDYERELFVVASSGEHDLDLAPGSRPSLFRNEWFASDPCVGACACFSAAAGAATLVAFADVAGGYRLISAEGVFTGDSFPSTGTANAGFRFARGLDGWREWCFAGANHHSSASPGSLGAQAAVCARFLGLDYWAV
jgi:L-arabinose isomerase